MIIAALATLSTILMITAVIVISDTADQTPKQERIWSTVESAELTPETLTWIREHPPHGWKTNPLDQTPTSRIP